MSITHGANDALPLRFMVHHLNPASARLRFLKSNNGHICQPEALPALSALYDDVAPTVERAVHPAKYFQKLCDDFSLKNDALIIEQGFRCWVDTPSQAVPIFLLRAVNESPFCAPEGFRWIELPDSFSLTDVERQMMRRCYQWLME